MISVYRYSTKNILQNYIEKNRWHNLESVNPARALAPAVFTGGEALTQVWLFIVAPLVGGAIAAVFHRAWFSVKED